LPFPAKELFPNKKNGKHWGATNAIKVAQKDTAFWLTRAEQKKTGWKDESGNIPISLLFLTPDRRKRDVDNMLAASKSILDGISLALEVDDCRFRPVLLDWVLGPKEGGLIVAVGIQIKSGLSLD
jgi:Holliday junction resolvase RusA-like endonuclease